MATERTYDLIMPLHGRQASFFVEAVLFEHDGIYMSPSVFGMQFIRSRTPEKLFEPGVFRYSNQLLVSRNRKLGIILHDWLNPAYRETERDFLARYGQGALFAFIHRNPVQNLASSYKTYLFNLARDFHQQNNRLPRPDELGPMGPGDFAATYSYLFDLEPQVAYYERFAGRMLHLFFEDLVTAPEAQINAVLARLGLSGLQGPCSSQKNTIAYSFFRYFCMHVRREYNGGRYLIGFGDAGDLRLLRGDLQVLAGVLPLGGVSRQVYLSYADLYENNFKDFWRLAADTEAITQHWSACTEFANQGEALVDSIMARQWDSAQTYLGAPFLDYYERLRARERGTGKG